MNTWILDTIKTKSLRTLVVWILAMPVVLYAAWQPRYLQNFILGPYSLDAADLDAIHDVSQAPKYFAKITGSDVHDLGLQEITTRERSGTIVSVDTATYHALHVGDRFLICKSRSGSNTTFEGTLSPLPYDVANNIFDTKEMQAMRDRFYPYYLDNASFYTPGYIGIVAFLVVLFLFIKYAVPAWRYFQNPATHPVSNRIQLWDDKIAIIAAMNREFRTPKYKSRNGWYVTDQFLIRSTWFDFDVLRLTDLLWAYTKVTRYIINFIPIGKTYEVIFICYGGAANVQVKKTKVDEILGLVAQRAPWAIFGFTKELKEIFNKQNAEFCAAVEQRKCVILRRWGAKKSRMAQRGQP